MTIYPEEGTISVPSIIISKARGKITNRSVGQAKTINDQIYIITCYAVDLNDDINIIDAEPLLHKMNKEIYRIFNDPDFIIRPSEDTNINFIKYDSSDEDVPYTTSPRLWACGHIIIIQFDYNT